MVNKFFLYGVILVSLISCKAKVPDDVIERDKMENLLYDYHLAQSLAKGGNDSIDYRIRLYTDAVFRKYKVNEEIFNHSMEWYTRNSEELFTIYKQLDKRFAEARSSGVVKGNRYASMTAVGDTMNVWEGKNFYLLTNTWNNYMDFQNVTDSTFSKGDKIMWQFDTHWYYQEGQKSATALLALVYENDSVAAITHNLYSTGNQEIYITVGNKPVKSLEGFVYLNTSWSESPKILTISDPVLVKFRKKVSNKPALKMKDVLATEDKDKNTVTNVDFKEGNDKVSTEISNNSNENTRILSLPR